MTPSLFIPVRGQEDLLRIAAIGPDRLNAAAEKVRALGLAAERASIRAQVAAAVGEEAAEAVVRQALALQPRVHLTKHENVKDVLDAVTEALASLKGQRQVSPDDLNRWNRARPGFEALVSCPSLPVCAKALDLAYEHERILQESRIVTDIRPVFDADDNSVEVRGVVIVHQLRLTFEQEGETRSLLCALDRQDLFALRAACERAIKKEEKLRDMSRVQRLFVFSLAENTPPE